MADLNTIATKIQSKRNYSEVSASHEPQHPQTATMEFDQLPALPTSTLTDFGAHLLDEQEIAEVTLLWMRAIQPIATWGA